MPDRHEKFADAMLRLFRSQKAVKTAVMDTSRENGLTGSGFQILMQLTQHGPARISGLAITMNVGASTMSRQIDLLIDRGFARKVTDPQDKRAHLVQATEAGEAVRTNQLERVRAVFRQVSQQLEPETIIATTNTCNYLAQAFTDLSNSQEPHSLIAPDFSKTQTPELLTQD